MMALLLTIEVLSFSPTSERSVKALHALQSAAPKTATATTTYRGDSELLVFWGPGAPERGEVMRRHVDRGGHAIALDLAYWDRQRKYRVSIDAAHPQKWVMRRDWPATRLRLDRIALQHRWKSEGPVIVAGIGRKARAQYGDAVDRWETQMIAAVRERWPGRQVRYRRKQFDAPVPAGVTLASDQPIETVLDGAGLVITWHSNVAVDAIRLGIPVICKDGAAAAVCPDGFGSDDPTPLDLATRVRFLGNLAWFQWTPTEARETWRWLQETLA